MHSLRVSTRECPQHRLPRLCSVGTPRVPRIFPAFHSGKSPAMWTLPGRPPRGTRAHVLLLTLTLTMALGGCSAMSRLPGFTGAVAAPNASAANVSVTLQARAAFAAGVAAYQSGDFARAIVQFQIAVADATPAPAAVLDLAAAQLAGGDAAGALQTLERPAAAAGCEIDLARGVLARRLGQMGTAQRSYERCLATEPDNAAAWRNLGVLQELYLGNSAAALVAYGHAQAAQPRPEVAAWVAALAGDAVGSAAP